MQNPFFRRQYTSPYRATARSGQETPAQRRSKVISIPVHFVDSEISRSTAAKRIQKVFRGFLVRKNVNKIAGIKKQVDEMEANLSLKETVDLVRKDGKERLKVNEGLMSLLLKLDSIRSFDSGVRDFRKSVIKKVIVLQERLDGVISGGEDLNKEMDEVAEEDAVDDEIEQIKYPIESTENQISQEEDQEDEDLNCVGRIEEEDKKEDSCDLEALEVESVEDENMQVTQEAVGDGGMEMENEEKPDLIQGKCEEKGGEERKEVMERMMEKNEILIGMVKELCEKNKMQTEMINSLSRRVDGLEKAFKRSKCKKRKQTTTAKF